MKMCLNPLIAKIKYNNNTKKNELSGFENFRKYCEKFGIDEFHQISKINELRYSVDTILLPCRKCINCQLNRSQEWAIRNTLESYEYDDSECLFLTLTYSNEKISHLQKHIIYKNGDIIEINSLWKPDLQKFIKKLRDVFDDKKIRYFACGEYGSKTRRPHYHLLLYGLSLRDIAIKVYQNKNWSLSLKYISNSYEYYYSELLENEVWSKGFVDVSTFSPFTAGYVSRYCTKKLSDKKFIDGYIFYNGLQKEFLVMSLKPAIAKNYYIKNCDEIYKNDEFLYHFNNTTIPLKPFKYWDRLYDIERPDEYKFIKENRKDFSKMNEYFSQLETNLSISEYLRNQEDMLYKKLKERSKV